MSHEDFEVVRAARAARLKEEARRAPKGGGGGMSDPVVVASQMADGLNYMRIAPDDIEAIARRVAELEGYAPHTEACYDLRSRISELETDLQDEAGILAVVTARLSHVTAENERLRREMDDWSVDAREVCGHDKALARLRRIEEAAKELLTTNVTSSAALRAALEGER